jgi:hypothetical protein
MAVNYAGISPQAQANLNYNPLTEGNLGYGSTNPVGTAGSLNLSGGENLASLSEMINSLTRQGQSAALGARIPGGPALEAQSSANIQNELGGKLPADVINQLQQQAAERGVATGSPGSPNSNAAYLKALGLTSLDLTNMGQSALTTAEGRNPAAPIFDPSSQLITPYQTATLSLQEQQMQNELALARARLAQQGALSGGRGGGGGGQAEQTGIQYVQGPWASDRPNPPALLSPYATTTGTSAPAGPYSQYGIPAGYAPYPATGTGETTGIPDVALEEDMANYLP